MVIVVIVRSARRQDRRRSVNSLGRWWARPKCYLVFLRVQTERTGHAFLLVLETPLSPHCLSITGFLPVTVSIIHSIVQRSGFALFRSKSGQWEESTGELPDADASNNSGFLGGLVQNVLQHHSVLTPGWGRDHQSLSRLAQGEGGLVVLRREVRRHDPIHVIADGSLFGCVQVLGFFTFVCAPSPQRRDVFIGEIHVVSKIHGANVSVSSPLSVSRAYRSQCKRCSPAEDLSHPWRVNRGEEHQSVPKSSEQCPNSHSLLINRDSVQVLAAKSEQHMNEKKKSWWFAQNRSQASREQVVCLLCMFTEVRWPYYKDKAGKILLAVSNHCNIPTGETMVLSNRELRDQSLFLSPLLLYPYTHTTTQTGSKTSKRTEI